MAPRDSDLSNKFIVTKKIFVSVLPDSNTLIPGKFKATTEADLPSNIYLLDTPEDDNSWFKHIKVCKNTELLEESCSLYPKYWKVYYRHALYYINKNDMPKASQVFTEALKFLVFLYHTASIHEYIHSLINAIEMAGLDYRSDIIWREWALILVKIYNCNLLSLNMTSGLLPDLFSMDQNVLKTPLIPNETEQIAFRSPANFDKDKRTYLALYGEVNALRNLFHRWLKTPTNNMRSLWDAYSIFENTIDSSGTLSTKLLGDNKNVINLSMRAYEVLFYIHLKITELYSKVYPIKAYSYEGTLSSKSKVKRGINNWMEIIKYEESNPLETDRQTLIERVIFNFERSLCPLVFSREMWYRYFQFLLFSDRRSEAIEKLELVLNNYLKDDEKLRFVLALYLDESGEPEKAHEHFAMLVLPGLRNKSSDLEQDLSGELKLRKLLQCKDFMSHEKSELGGIIHYLNFVRKERDVSEWREEVQLILSKSDLSSWDLYWYAASTEMRCFKDYDRAIQILKQAQSKISFDFNYTLLFLNTMLNVGKHNDVRVLLSELIAGSMDKSSKITETDRDHLWNFWLNMEYLYGSSDQFNKVKSLYVSSMISAKLSLDTFSEQFMQGSKPTVFALYSDISEAFEKSTTNSKRKIAQDLGAIVESRRKLFCSGIDFEHLDNIFKFNLFFGAVGLSSYPPDTNGVSRNSVDDSTVTTQLPSTNVADHDTADRSEGTEDQNQQVKTDLVEKADKSKTKKTKTKKGKPQPQDNEPEELKDFTDKPTQEYVSAIKYGTKICRPNVSRLSEIEPKMTTSLESLVQLHGSKRPILPPKFRPLDSTGTPCKALFDFIRLLPSSKDNKFSNLYVNTESIDYLIRTVENMDLGNIEIDQYQPLPTNLSNQLKQTDETLNEKSFEFNQGLENILRFLQDNALFDERPVKKQKIAI
uniref:Suppressor of forked protein (Suf), putative n=1 Tax=Theileria annulata TaxID=5874 RepID=A0A3B0MEK4_THEAN